ncbi:MAG: VanZ family protein [Xylophilus ampelinus]
MLTVWALVAYRSLFPFAYVPHAPSWSDAWTLLTAWPARLSTADAVGNVLLFMPLGALVAARLGGRAAWLAAGIAYAWAVQYLQFWFPSRVPSASDAWFNTAGLLAGCAAGVMLRRLMAERRGWRADGAPYWAPATALLLAWVAYRWFPLVPSLDVQNLKNDLKPLLLAPAWDSLRVLHDATAWLLWLRLLQCTPLRGLPGSRAAWAAVCIVAAEPLFWANTVSLSNVAGLGIALALRPRFAPGPAGSWMLALLLAASLVASGLAPWQFEDAGNDFLWMPFAGMLRGSMYVNSAALVEKCFLYGGLVFLMGHGGMGFRPAGWVAAALLGGIELAQCWVPGRVPEITDPLLAVLAGALLASLAPAGRTAGRPGRAAARLPRERDAVPGRGRGPAPVAIPAPERASRPS